MLLLLVLLPGLKLRLAWGVAIVIAGVCRLHWPTKICHLHTRHDATRRGAHLVASPVCVCLSGWLVLPAWLLSSFWHRVNHNFAPSFTTMSTVGHVSETTCQIYHGIARHRLAWRLSETWPGPMAHPLAHPGNKLRFNYACLPPEWLANFLLPLLMINYRSQSVVASCCRCCLLVWR